MDFRNIFFSQSIKDFFSLFVANIFQKILGLVRELVIAFFLGSSILYANFLLLRVVADFFSQITAGNALKANLLPKFTKLYNKHDRISLKEVFRFSGVSSVYLFIISQIIQTGVIFYLGIEDNSLFFLASFILSFCISFNFINTIFLTIMQARGFFLRYSYASVTNSLVFTFLVYPLVSMFSFVGLAISRMLGIISMSLAFVIPMRKERIGQEVNLEYSDFNFPTLILGNFANIIIISSRFVSGSDGSNSITFFMYAVVILNALLTSVITNVSTILLRKISLKGDKRLMIYSLLISFFLGSVMVLILYFFSFDIIKFIYLRGAFSLSDVQQTAIYLYELSFGFLLLFIATILFQPFLSLSIMKTKHERLKLASSFLIVLLLSSCVVFFPSFISREKSLIVMYASSFFAVVLSIYSYRKYLIYEDK
tara:strand:+ start:232 stop:1506 length:1275 start_codon:yes stop_codon:yes gene_type:complete